MEYCVKDQFLRALADRYEMSQMGLGEPLWCRTELEDALRQHAADGRPAIKDMVRDAKQRAKERLKNGSV